MIRNSHSLANLSRQLVCGFALLLSTVASAEFDLPEASSPTLALKDSQSGGLYEMRRNMQEFGSELLISRPAAIREMLSTESNSREQTHVKLNGPDSQTRPVAVTFQRAFEQSIINMLQKGNIKRQPLLFILTAQQPPYAIKVEMLITTHFPSLFKWTQNA